MAKKTVKVLHVLVCLGGGGVETLLLNLQKLLSKHITCDYLVAHSDFRDKEAQELGSTVHLAPADMQHPTRWGTLVGRLVKEHRYDIVHFHRFAFSGNVMKAAKQAGAKGRIAHSHGSHMKSNESVFLKRLLYSPYHWTINRWQISQYATHIIGCSSDALRHLMGSYEKNPKCRVVLNGIPIEDFAKRIDTTTKAELCQRYGIPVDALVIGNLGRLEPVKNHEFLLRVFDVLKQRNQTEDSGLFIGGGGSLQLKLEQQRDMYSLQDSVTLPGHCTNVPELLGNLFDCFVTPSRMEGFGLNVVEAVAAGLYVVCSDNIPKDVTDAFPDRITTLPLSAPLECWAKAVEEAVQNRISPQQGLELVRNSPMTFQHFTEEMVGIYENIAEM
jgi:glycosyltransferase involved in cell wall biosynthesis